jgi:2-polyprenyl-6-hydroxyphenyl methylase/3-demethylubiquinone-9 3-methyltransferase
MKNADNNIDEAELARFESMASIWWDRNGEQKALHDINILRLNYIDERSHIQGKRVLDVACGGGILSEAMAARGADVTGIDAGKQALMVAKQHLKQSNLQVNYQAGTAEEFSNLHPESFEVVTCMELLEHVPDPALIVAACSKLVKPGGDVFFATLNRNPKSFLFAIIAAEYILGLVRKGTHTYRKFIKPCELENWAISAALIKNDLTGLHYNPLLRKYALGGNVHVNYMMHFCKEK